MSRGFAGLVAASVLYLTALPAEAQPTVTGVQGTVGNDRIITISGASFGTKSEAAPLVWEDFSDGELHPSLTPHGVFTVDNADNLRHPFGVRNARADFKLLDSNWESHYFQYNGGTAPKWFVQYWIKLATNWHWGTTRNGGSDDGLANVKFFRMFPKGSRTYANVGYSTHGFADGDVLRFVENGDQTYLGINGQDFFTPGAWHSVQIEYGENGGAGQTNGRMRLWIDGVLKDATTMLDTNPVGDGEPIDKRPYVIGFYDSWGPSDDQSADNMYAYYSDLYVDSSWSRVELGNAPTYAASTHREMLIPTAWSGSSISARVTQGTFRPGDKAYIYVTDASGQVNATGFKVNISAAGGNPPQRK
jgi:hypothetical protein